MPRAVGPLGLLETIDQADVARLRLAEQSDLSRVAGVLTATRAEYIPGEEVDTVVRDLKRFLSLNLLVRDPEFEFVPSFKIDLAWHEFILHTRDYTAFCDALVGSYIHHTPQATRAISRALVSGEPFLYTKQQLQRFTALHRRSFGAFRVPAILPRFATVIS